MVCNIGGARCVSFAGQMTTRVLTAFIISPPIGIGSGVVAELCPPEKRGQKLGWWVLMTVLGTPLGPFIMGFVVQHAGVHWIFWIFVIINFLQAVAYLLFGEETLYIRDSKNPCDTSSHSRLRSLLPRRINPAPFRARDAFAPILLVRHSRILVPAIATGITFCYGNIAFVVEMPISFGEKFNFNAQQIGLQFLSIIIGAVIGEQLSGPMSDAFLKARARARNGPPRPADRLWLAYIGFATLFAGILTWGFQLQKAETWNVTPCVGVAIASFGNQVQSTILTAYAVDSHKDLSAAIGVFVNFVRLIYGFVCSALLVLPTLFAALAADLLGQIGPFYFPNMFALGYGTAAGVMCAVSAVGGLVPTIAIHIATSR